MGLNRTARSFQRLSSYPSRADEQKSMNGRTRVLPHAPTLNAPVLLENLVTVLRNRGDADIFARLFGAKGVERHSVV